MKGNKLSRQRSHVIQSNSPLPTVAERHFFILVYLKNNPTQEYQGVCFGMSQQQCGQWVQKSSGQPKINVDCARTTSSAIFST